MSLANGLPKGLLAMAAALLVATPVLAQEPPPAAEPAAAAAPAAPATPASAPSAYSDSQMRAFARATIDLQLVDPRDVSGQARAIETTGLSVEQYNQMGDAMRADPQLASRLNPYLASARTERPAIPGYTPGAYARSYASSSSYRTVAHHSSKSHARKGRASHASKRGHKGSSSHHAKAASHRKKTTAHHATTHHKRRH